MYKKWPIIVFFIILAVVVLPPVLTLVRQQPTLATSIRTWSMAPQLNRGDMVFLLPVWESTELSQGQIIVFKAPEHGIRDWTMHRIVGGDAASGYITKGDANEGSDQAGSGYPPINPEWIGGVVPTIGSTPLKIPLLGYLPLIMDDYIQSPVFIPSFLGVLAVALVVDEIFKSKKRRRKESLQKHHLYFMGGLAFAVLMAAVMLMGSLFISLPYRVGESPGALMGSEVGMLEKGDSREVTLAELQNHGSVPAFYLAVSSDPQVELEQSYFFLRGGEEAELKATVHARETGKYEADVTVGMFLPFLPQGAIRLLASSGIWLAFSVIALIPALPLFFLPCLEPRFRRRFCRDWRQRLEKITWLFR